MVDFILVTFEVSLLFGRINLFACYNVRLVSNVIMVTGTVPSYSGVSLLKNPKDTTAYQGKDPTIIMECFPNRRFIHLEIITFFFMYSI